jgi:hypothetical protein
VVVEVTVGKATGEAAPFTAAVTGLPDQQPEELAGELRVVPGALGRVSYAPALVELVTPQAYTAVSGAVRGGRATQPLIWDAARTPVAITLPGRVRLTVAALAEGLIELTLQG